MGSPHQHERVPLADLRRACAELENSLGSGEAGDAEAVFTAHPALGDDPDAALEVIYTEFVARERLGLRPEPSDYYARFPRWREGLQELFDIHRAAGGNSAMFASGAPQIDPEREYSGTVNERAATRRLGNYELIGEIGRGGMGVVYKARQIGLNRLVALKMILTGEDAGLSERARFRREAEAAACLHHPNIVQIHEVGEHEGRSYLSLELVEGGTLDDFLTGTPCSAQESAKLIETLARAIHHAHEQGIVHRDLKPANILLQSVPTDTLERGKKPAAVKGPKVSGSCATLTGCVPKITDFGLARRLPDGETSTDLPAGPTRTGAIVGTPAYMAPEQTLGHSRDTGPAADIYALGAILYELLTGRPPFMGVNVLETLEHVRLRDPLPPSRLLPGLPRDLETICMKCLRKEAGQRYKTAEALADDLRRYQLGEPIHARPTPTWEKAWKWAKRRPAIVFLLVALGMTLAGGVTGVAVSWRQTAAALDREREQKNELEKVLAEKLISLAQRDWIANDLELAQRHLDECPPAHRGHEWRYLNRVCNACLGVLETGESPADVRSIVWSPDGRSIAASAYLRGTFAVWDPTTGVRRFTVKGSSPHQANQLAFNSEGLLVSVTRVGATINSQDFEVRTLEMEKGREVSSQVLSVPSDGGYTRLMASGRSIAIGDRSQGSLMVLDIPSQTMSTSLTLPKGLVFTPVMSADGQYLAWWSNRQEVHIWDTVTGQLTVPPIPTKVGQIMAFSPDGSRIAVAGYHRETNLAIALVRETRTGKEIASMRIQGGNLFQCVAFSPDGRRLATSGMGHCVVVWDLETGREELTFRGHRDQVLSLAFSPEGDRLASGSRDGTIRIWNVRPFDPAAD
jgi:serine/threonine protein kinase/WD40 repeat protein